MNNIENSNISTCKKGRVVESIIEKRKLTLGTINNNNHKLEKVNIINGVTFINDSKSTDVLSTVMTLKIIEKPVIWILDTAINEKYRLFFEDALLDNVKGICGIGTSNQIIAKIMKNAMAPCRWVENIADAVLWCNDLTDNGDVVLFSPACPTYNEYADYRERGNEFIHEVQQLTSI